MAELLFVHMKSNPQMSKVQTITRKQFRWFLLLWKKSNINRNYLDVCLAHQQHIPVVFNLSSKG